MKHDSKRIAQALIRAQAIEALQALVTLGTTQKLTREQLTAARRARQNAALIRTLDRK